MILSKDNTKLGLLLGTIAPLLGLLAFKWYNFGIYSYKVFFVELFNPLYNYKILTASLSISLLANALIFTLYINAGKDKTAKGIFITTCIYGLVILLIKTFA